MRTLVCGGRAYTNWIHLDDTLFQFYRERGPITCIIEGEAPGADTMARVWAEHHEVPVEKYPADWKKHGKAAGPIRNKQMLDEGKPDIVIAFAGGRGTANMIKQARGRGIEVIEAWGQH